MLNLNMKVMKTINTKFRVVFIMLLGTGLMFTQNIATGQSRTRGDRTSNNREYTRTDTRNDRGYTRTGNRNKGDRNNNGQRYQHGEKKHPGKTFQNYGKHQNHQKHNIHKKHYENHNSDVTVYWNVPGNYYRNHWDYNVYYRNSLSHRHRPVVFQHRHGKAYYYDGLFYRYEIFD